VGLKEELKERGLKRAELFNWKESTKETISLYERLLI
jgi:glycosyltransferase involved in cell wall biosynthesis